MVKKGRVLRSICPSSFCRGCRANPRPNLEIRHAYRAIGSKFLSLHDPFLSGVRSPILSSLISTRYVTGKYELPLNGLTDALTQVVQPTASGKGSETVMSFASPTKMLFMFDFINALTSGAIGNGLITGGTRQDSGKKVAFLSARRKSSLSDIPQPVNENESKRTKHLVRGAITVSQFPCRPNVRSLG